MTRRCWCWTGRGRRVAAALAAVAALGPRAAAQHPAWAQLEGIVVGGPVDAVFPLGFACRPARTPGAPLSSVSLADVLFGSVVHPHRVNDAVAGAVERGTVCAGRIWGDSALVVVFATERRIGALSVLYAAPGLTPMAPDDVRRRVRAVWGRGGGQPELETWGTGRYRAYLLASPWARPPTTTLRVTMYDVRACTAFERLVHELGEPGPPTTC